MRSTAKRATKVQTTVRLPKPLYDKAKQLIRRGEVRVGSVNELMIESLQSRIRAVERQHIDAQFASMSEDRHYQRQAERVTEEFEPSDWEALQER
ncbi:MAG TPA: CopG family transcriptional regulator [Terriglobia bacterium]|nr:CopG family transcriptional regulator [Terriglobia bacterium]